jgi:hypothetical protein
VGARMTQDLLWILGADRRHWQTPATTSRRVGLHPTRNILVEATYIRLIGHCSPPAASKGTPIRSLAVSTVPMSARIPALTTVSLKVPASTRTVPVRGRRPRQGPNRSSRRRRSGSSYQPRTVGGTGRSASDAPSAREGRSLSWIRDPFPTSRDLGWPVGCGRPGRPCRGPRRIRG